MNYADYARSQARSLGPLQKLIRAVLHALGVPVTPDQREETAVRLYRPILAARDANYRATLAYLQHERLPSGLSIPTPRSYPITAISSTLERVVDRLRVEGEPIAGDLRADRRVIELARPAIEGPLGRHALEPARETIAGIGQEEVGANARYGWARVLVGAYSCAFCAMLASRGPVYTSKEAATGRGGTPLDVFHTPYPNANGKIVGGFCDCQAVIVPRDRPWEGQEAHRRLETLWQDSTEGEHYTQALKAFRRQWDAKVRKGETEQYLPPSLKKKPEPVLLPKPKREPKPKPVEPVPAPVKPDLLTLPRIETPLDPAADLATVNPRHQESLQWQINCTRCATAIELRARGYDVTAGPKPERIKDNDHASILNRWLSPDGRTAAGVVGTSGQFGTVDRLSSALYATLTPGSPDFQKGHRPAAIFRAPIGDETPLGMAHVPMTQGMQVTGHSRVWDYLPAGKGQDGPAKNAADAAVLAWGHGARGYITVEWQGGGAHIFNVENRDGKVVYLDGQVNRADNAEAWDRIKNAGKNCRIVRTDDLTPRESGPNTTGVNEWVIPRDAKYLKAEQRREKEKAAKKAEHEEWLRGVAQRNAEREAAIAAGEKPAVAVMIDAAKEAGVTRLGDFVRGVEDAFKAFKTGGDHVDPDYGNADDGSRAAYRAGVIFYRKWRRNLVR